MFLVRNRSESVKEAVSFVYRTNLPEGDSDEVVSLLQCFSWGDTSFTLVSKWEMMGLLGKRRPCSSSNSCWAAGISTSGPCFNRYSGRFQSRDDCRF